MLVTSSFKSACEISLSTTDNHTTASPAISIDNCCRVVSESIGVTDGKSDRTASSSSSPSAVVTANDPDSQCSGTNTVPGSCRAWASSSLTLSEMLANRCGSAVITCCDHDSSMDPTGYRASAPATPVVSASFCVVEATCAVSVGSIWVSCAYTSTGYFVANISSVLSCAVRPPVRIIATNVVPTINAVAVAAVRERFRTEFSCAILPGIPVQRVSQPI